MVTGLPGTLGISLATRIDLIDGDIFDPPNITDGGARLHRTKSDDLSDLVIAIFVSSIFHHFSPAVIPEIQVDIRHRNTSWIEEAFEDQAMLDGIDQGDFQGIGHNRTGR